VWTFIGAVRRVAEGGTALDRKVVSTLANERRRGASAEEDAIETLAAHRGCRHIPAGRLRGSVRAGKPAELRRTDWKGLLHVLADYNDRGWITGKIIETPGFRTV
jgi:hypothetical protein